MGTKSIFTTGRGPLAFYSHWTAAANCDELLHIEILSPAAINPAAVSPAAICTLLML